MKYSTKEQMLQPRNCAWQTKAHAVKEFSSLLDNFLASDISQKLCLQSFFPWAGPCSFKKLTEIDIPKLVKKLQITMARKFIQRFAGTQTFLSILMTLQTNQPF